MEELEKRKLIVLLPFQLLRLRKAIEKARTPENITALKKLICHDIINSIKQNVAAGNITQMESMKLRQMVLYLYQHIYSKYDELEKEGVNHMAEDALIFEVDILDYKIRKLEEKNQLLETANQSLENANQSLENAVQSLTMENQVLKLYSQGVSVGEIAEKTGQSPERVKTILET